MALKFHGHVFDSVDPVCTCCVGDASGVLSDPTQTGAFRRKLRAVMALRWRSMRVLIREIILTKDVLGLKNAGLTNLAAPMLVQGGTRIQLFQRWWQQASTTIVMGNDGSVFRPTISQVYSWGEKFAQASLPTPVMNIGGQAHQDALLQWAIVELQGVQDAVGQKILRAASQGILNRHKPMAIVREVWAAIDSAGIPRTNMLIESLVTKAFTDGTLDTYEAAGVEEIGILPEAKRPSLTLGDAKAKPMRRGAGSRISRTQNPSESTVRRIKKQEELLEKKLGKGVYVRTAEDENVCPICEKLSYGGPYTLNQARGLVPAHPHCRCAFIPAFDKRYRRPKRRPAEEDDDE